MLKELSEISTNLKFKRKNMLSDYRDNNYANIEDIEYMFGDLDDYYKPILVQGLLIIVIKDIIVEVIQQDNVYRYLFR